MRVSSPRDVFCFSATPLIDCKDLHTSYIFLTAQDVYCLTVHLGEKYCLSHLKQTELFTDWCTNRCRRSGHTAALLVFVFFFPPWHGVKAAYFLSISDTFFKNRSSKAFHLSFSLLWRTFPFLLCHFTLETLLEQCGCGDSFYKWEFSRSLAFGAKLKNTITHF